jgi:hypothetical protein
LQSAELKRKNARLVHEKRQLELEFNALKAETTNNNAKGSQIDRLKSELDATRKAKLALEAKLTAAETKLKAEANARVAAVQSKESYKQVSA